MQVNLLRPKNTDVYVPKHKIPMSGESLTQVNGCPAHVCLAYFSGHANFALGEMLHIYAASQVSKIAEDFMFKEINSHVHEA